jgi:hypothetical protein
MVEGQDCLVDSPAALIHMQQPLAGHVQSLGDFLRRVFSGLGHVVGLLCHSAACLHLQLTLFYPGQSPIGISGASGRPQAVESILVNGSQQRAGHSWGSSAGHFCHPRAHDGAVCRVRKSFWVRPRAGLVFF